MAPGVQSRRRDSRERPSIPDDAGASLRGLHGASYRHESSRSWSSSCLLSSCDLGMEGVEPVLPEPAVLSQPLVDLDERLWAECVDPALRVLAYVDQPGLPQHAEMPGNARACDR